jgi:hypothetical protein
VGRRLSKPGALSFRFQFTNLKIAMMYLKYWPTSILLNGSMMRIEKCFRRAESSLDMVKIKHKPAAGYVPDSTSKK